MRPEIDAASYLFIVNFYIAGAALLLMGSYTLERTERREFLERMRVEFLAGHIEKVARTDLSPGSGTGITSPRSPRNSPRATPRPPSRP